jgi:hypothetical protein
MNGRNLADQMEDYTLKLMRDEGYTRHEAEAQAYAVFIGEDEHAPERYENLSKGEPCAS